MTVSATPVRRSRFALRFSLRVLFAAFTAVAIGFPLWYRWPYEDVVVRTPTAGDPFANYKEFRQITSWQRQWGGGKLRHGSSRTARDGITSSETMFRAGKRHGPYRSFFITGPLARQGQYFDDKEDGSWTHYNEDGSVKATFTWRRGVLDGRATITDRSGHYRLVYQAGRVVEVNDKPVEHRLNVLADAEADSPAIRESLKDVIGLAIFGLPLDVVAKDLSKRSRVPIVIDDIEVDPSRRVNFNGHEMDLAAGLSVMTTVHDLGCDYRFGSIWITSKEGAKDWRDTTGVSSIVPPKGSALATAWNEPVSILETERPLARALALLAETLAIEIDVSQIDGGDEAARYPVSLELKEHPFRHVLGILLYKTRCRCRLEGEKLVILPPP